LALLNGLRCSMNGKPVWNEHPHRRRISLTRLIWRRLFIRGKTNLSDART
jgi:hypothetical protein